MGQHRNEQLGVDKTEIVFRGKPDDSYNDLRIDPAKKRLPITASDSFSDRWENSRFLALRILYHILRSAWTVVMVVGGFIAWLIAMLFI